MDPTMQNDPDIAALQRAATVQRLKTLGIVAALIALPVLYWVMGFSSVRSMLEADGYSNVKVSYSSPFEFKFTAKKGVSECSGAVTRLPFSSSMNSYCFSVDDQGRGSGSLETTRH